MMTSSTEALSTPARESAAVMAAAPSAGALTLLSAPPNAPTAVRAAAMSLGLAAWMEVLTNRNTSSQFAFVLSSRFLDLADLYLYPGSTHTSVRPHITTRGGRTARARLRSQSIVRVASQLAAGSDFVKITAKSHFE